MISVRWVRFCSWPRYCNPPVSGVIWEWFLSGGLGFVPGPDIVILLFQCHFRVISVRWVRFCSGPRYCNPPVSGVIWEWFLSGGLGFVLGPDIVILLFQCHFRVISVRWVRFCSGPRYCNPPVSGVIWEWFLSGRLGFVPGPDIVILLFQVWSESDFCQVG